MVVKKRVHMGSRLPDKFSVAVGNRLLLARERRELTLRELAEKMSTNGHRYTFGGLAQIERGEVDCTVRVLCQIAKALEVTPGALFDANWRRKL